MSKKEALIGELEKVDSAIADAKQRRDTILQSLAELTCPYKVGDRLRTSNGLGVNGLVVDSILAPQFPSEGNWWQVNTFAISKAGEVTRRNVGISQSISEYSKLEVVK